MAELKKVVKYITIDTAAPQQNPVARVKRGDRGTRYLSVLICDGRKEYEIPPDALLRVNWEKPDGHICYNVAEHEEGTNRVLVELTNQMLLAPGIAECDVEVISADNVQILSSAVFCIEIEDGKHNDEAMLSTDEMTALEKITERAEKAKEESAASAAAAAQSATDADQSATDAAASAAAAKTSETNAKASETAAAQSAASAAGSATKAGASETNAKASETAAAQSAASAAGSATKAGTSENNAKASETAAAQSAASAAGSATKAGTSETNARASETAAAQSATAAAGSATAAEQAAEEAREKAQEIMNSDAGATKTALERLERRLKSGTIQDAELHLGFYLDENGDLCQMEE